MKTTATITALLAVLLATQSIAATYRVELDGSADFTNLQPAVDAAATGDTIQIGPGRWDQYVMYEAPGWTDQVVVAVDYKNLTLIGSGQDVTYLGPEVAPTEWNNPGPIAPDMMEQDGVSSVSI